MRAMDSRRDFTSKKVFSGYFSELGEKANSALLTKIGVQGGSQPPGQHEEFLFLFRDDDDDGVVESRRCCFSHSEVAPSWI